MKTVADQFPETLAAAGVNRIYGTMAHGTYNPSIEDYALIGDCTTAALVSRDGSINWLCWPRFDSDACFAALLGTADNGHWRIAPVDAEVSVNRLYRPGTMILETRFTTAAGSVVQGVRAHLRPVVPAKPECAGRDGRARDDRAVLHCPGQLSR
jgi:hypothetical protein